MLGWLSKGHALIELILRAKIVNHGVMKEESFRISSQNLASRLYATAVFAMIASKVHDAELARGILSTGHENRLRFN